MKYNLERFDLIFADILRKGKPSSYELNAIKQELNKFYQGDTECSEIFYTNNTDKAFFGMKVYPNLRNDHIIHTFTLTNETDMRNAISSYIVEFDSKLFDELNNFEPREITAILMHEVGHLAQNNKVNNDIIRSNISHFQTKNRTNISYDGAIRCMELFKYAYIHTIEAFQSIFLKNQEEFEADRFSIEMGYGPDLESAFTKILKCKGTIQPQGKLNTFIWSLTVYRSIVQRKKFIVKCMDELNQYSGSKLEKEANTKLRNSVIASHSGPIHECMIQDRVEYINESILNGVKRSGLKAIEDDTYVYQIRIKNVDNEFEAMDIMRDINSKINIVSDYLAYEKNINEYDKKRWTMLLDKLESLRDQLATSDSYKKSTYGLWLKLPITQRRY